MKSNRINMNPKNHNLNYHLALRREHHRFRAYYKFTVIGLAHFRASLRGGQKLNHNKQKISKKYSWLKI